jgi:diacylglycerol kinase (ATP)
MSTVAVIAHSDKSLGGGLGQLRRVLADRGFPEPLWYEVAKAKQAPDAVVRALGEGADLVFIWGGDGTVRRCLDKLAGGGVPLAVLPAGTGNLLAGNLGVPEDIAKAVDIGLHGRREVLDLGRVNDGYFSVMAGAGFDARMIASADDTWLKERLGRAAYVWSGARSLGTRPISATVEVDGRLVHAGGITCALVGNMSQVFGGVDVFDDSRPDDARLEVAVVTARTRIQWLHTLLRVLLGRAEDSPFVASASGESIRVRFDKPTAYELDGDLQDEAQELAVEVRPASLTVCVPETDGDISAARR